LASPSTGPTSWWWPPGAVPGPTSDSLLPPGPANRLTPRPSEAHAQSAHIGEADLPGRARGEPAQQGKGGDPEFAAAWVSCRPWVTLSSSPLAGGRDVPVLTPQIACHQHPAPDLPEPLAQPMNPCPFTGHGLAMTSRTDHLHRHANHPFCAPPTGWRERTVPVQNGGSARVVPGQGRLRSVKRSAPPQ